MRLAVTSVIRHADAQSKSGFVHVIDWPSGDILARLPIPESVARAGDRNPRGGFRGVRGVTVCGNRLLVANADRIFVCDRSWRLDGEITHPLMGGNHDILADDEGVWTCCTNSDLLLKFSWSGALLREWDCRADSAFARQLRIEWAPPVRRDLDYRQAAVAARNSNILHLNSLNRDGDGRLVVSLGRIRPQHESWASQVKRTRRRWLRPLGAALHHIERLGGRGFEALPSISGGRCAVIRLGEGGGATGHAAELIWESDGAGVPNHNATLCGTALIYNDSNAHCLTRVDLQRDSKVHTVRIPGDRPFVRGLCQTGPDLFICGSQNPAALFEVDIEEQRTVREVVVSKIPNESVYGICEIPDSFDDPPEMLRC